MRPFCFLLLCCAVSGCAYRATLRSNSPPEDFAKANRAFQSLRCQVQLFDTTLEGQSNVQFESDTIRWKDPATGETNQAPFADVYCIKATSHKKGIIPGAVAGLLIGWAAGAAVGAAQVKNSQSGGGFGDISSGIALGFGIGIPVFLGGILIGYSIGVPVEAYNDAYLDIYSPLRNR